jgi:hypothetical protein
MHKLQINKKQEELELALSIFYPKFWKKHPLKECPLNRLEICGICEQDHATSSFPSLSGLKHFYQDMNV